MDEHCTLQVVNRLPLDFGGFSV